MFYDKYWELATFVAEFGKWYHTKETYREKFRHWVISSQYRDLSEFLEARIEKREESVWRLRQWLAVSENKEKEFLKNSWGLKKNA
jgi:cysteinyl-tRNA synthetase